MKIIKQIPNAITSMNLICGALGIIAAFKGWLDTAFYLMLAGALCDFCDGLAARLLKAYSRSMVLLHSVDHRSILSAETCEIQRRQQTELKLHRTGNSSMCYDLRIFCYDFIS